MRTMTTGQIDRSLPKLGQHVALSFGDNGRFSGSVSRRQRDMVVFSGGQKLAKRYSVGYAGRWFFGSGASEHWEPVHCVGRNQRSLMVGCLADMSPLAIAAVLARLKTADMILVGYGHCFLSYELTVVDTEMSRSLNPYLVNIFLSDSSKLFRPDGSCRYPWRFLSAAGRDYQIWAVAPVVNGHRAER